MLTITDLDGNKTYYNDKYPEQIKYWNKIRDNDCRDCDERCPKCGKLKKKKIYQKIYPLGGPRWKYTYCTKR